MTTILHIETSGLACSVAVSQNNDCKCFKLVHDEQYRHAEVLHGLIQAVLGETGLTLKQLDAVAVSMGPGSYTGLRVGFSAAKGLCYGLDIPLITINTLRLIALEAAKTHTLPQGGRYIAMLDARRAEVYLQEFNRDLNEISTPQAVVLTDYHPAEGNLVFCGNGSEKAKAYYTRPGNIFLPAVNPLAGNMVDMALAKFENKVFEDVAYVEPFYLKEFYTGAKPA